MKIVGPHIFTKLDWAPIGIKSFRLFKLILIKSNNSHLGAVSDLASERSLGPPFRILHFSW